MQSEREYLRLLDCWMMQKPKNGGRGRVKTKITAEGAKQMRNGLIYMIVKIHISFCHFALIYEVIEITLKQGAAILFIHL